MLTLLSKILSMKRFLPFILVAFLGAGCRASSPANTSSSASSVSVVVNPCTLLTKDEVMQYLEMPAADGKRITNDSFPFADSCLYGIEVKPGSTSLQGISRTVDVQVTTDHPDFSAKEWYWKLKDGAKQLGDSVGQAGKNAGMMGDPYKSITAPVDVPGIGDDAYSNGKGIYALKGNVMLYVSVGSFSEPKPDKTLDAMKKVFARLP